jgi:RHS repeat-associated protein
VKTGTVTIWYSLLRDNLGSITHVVDSLNNVSEYSYDAWGRRRNPVNWNYDLTGQPNLLAGRGFTGHETMTEFGLINMNGRLYDPAVGRFLSPDPYVQAPDFTQNLNRYAYGLNNPLKYNDPSGEFLNLLIGAIIVGVINWVTHGAELNIEGLGYFGVGVFAGALGAGVGTGISSIMAGGTFGAGFIGSSAAMMATTSFATNAAIGSGALFSAGFTNGLGNGLMGGQNFGQALGSGFNDGLIGGVSGGLIDGIAGGIDAAIDGRRFFDGATVRDQVLANQNIPIIGQRGDNNCLPASAEAVDKSLGGNMTQEQVRALPGLGGDPNTVPLGDVDVWEKYASASKHTLNGEVGKPSSYYKIIGDMSKGGRVAINLNTGNVGHSVVMQRVVERTITKISGKILPKNLYYVMNPGNGGSITRISARSISNALHIFSIFP